MLSQLYHSGTSPSLIRARNRIIVIPHFISNGEDTSSSGRGREYNLFDISCYIGLATLRSSIAPVRDEAIWRQLRGCSGSPESAIC